MFKPWNNQTGRRKPPSFSSASSSSSSTSSSQTQHSPTNSTLGLHSAFLACLVLLSGKPIGHPFLALPGPVRRSFLSFDRSGLPRHGTLILPPQISTTSQRSISSFTEPKPFQALLLPVNDQTASTTSATITTATTILIHTQRRYKCSRTAHATIRQYQFTIPSQNERPYGWQSERRVRARI